MKLFSLIHSSRLRNVVRQSGTVRSFLPLPWSVTLWERLRSTSFMVITMASDTRAPVLYISLKSMRSRLPLQEKESGASRIASISCLVKNPNTGLLKRLKGTARERWIEPIEAGSKVAANLKNDRMAASRMFRVRIELARSVSR